MAQWDGIDEAVAVSDCGSFAGAAGRLGVSTSHISRAVARLEDRLGATLFHRTTRRVSLTDTGRNFTEQCRRLIQEREELLSLAAGNGEPQGELRLTCSISLGERFIAPIIGEFVDQYPMVSVVMDFTNRLVDLVGEGYDIGIRTRHVADSRLAGREIARRNLETCASPSYLAERGAPINISDLSQHNCLAGIASTWHFIENGIPRSFVPAGRWRCNSGNAVVAASLAGRGICQLPTFYVQRHLSQNELRPVLTQCQSEPEPIWIVYPQRRHLLPKISLLVRAISTELPVMLGQH
jgi:DNA-binding transcriptional LysR family regulator